MVNDLKESGIGPQWTDLIYRLVDPCGEHFRQALHTHRWQGYLQIALLLQMSLWKWRIPKRVEEVEIYRDFLSYRPEVPRTHRISVDRLRSQLLREHMHLASVMEWIRLLEISSSVASLLPERPAVPETEGVARYIRIAMDVQKRGMSMGKRPFQAILVGLDEVSS